MSYIHVTYSSNRKHVHIENFRKSFESVDRRCFRYITNLFFLGMNVKSLTLINRGEKTKTIYFSDPVVCPSLICQLITSSGCSAYMVI